MIDLHAINRKITFFDSKEECITLDSFMIDTYSYSTAVGRKC